MLKNVLIFVHIKSHFNEMIRVARLLKASNRYCPIIYFKAAYEGYLQDKEICQAENIKVIEPDEIFNYSIQEIRKESPITQLTNHKKSIFFGIKKIIRYLQNNIAKVNVIFTAYKNASLEKISKIVDFCSEGISKLIAYAVNFYRSIVNGGLFLVHNIRRLFSCIGVYGTKLFQRVFNLIKLIDSLVIKLILVTLRMVFNQLRLILHFISKIAKIIFYPVKKLVKIIFKPLCKHTKICGYLGGKVITVKLHIKNNLYKAERVFKAFLLKLLEKRNMLLIKSKLLIVKIFFYLGVIFKNIMRKCGVICEYIAKNMLVLFKSVGQFLLLLLVFIYKSFVCLINLLNYCWLYCLSFGSLNKNKIIERSCINRIRIIKNKLVLKFSELIEEKLTQNDTVNKISTSLLFRVVEPFCYKLIRLIFLQLYQLLWECNRYLLPSITQYIYVNYQTMPYLFKRYNIHLVILPEDNFFYLTHLLVHFAKKNSIKTIIIPFTIANTQEWAEAFYNDPKAQISGFANKLGQYCYPAWVCQYRGRKLILPMEYVLAFSHLKIDIPNPWLINSGQAAVIAVESPFMYNYYLQAGLEQERMVITGALYDDILYNHLQNSQVLSQKYCKQLKFERNLPILLCAIPPDQLATDRKDCEFLTYAEILHYILERLSIFSDRFNIVLSLHPRINRNDVQYINNYPIKIADQNIADLIPLAKIFIASCSATIRMAIACGIPVINYDVYKYFYDDYISAKGVITVSTKHQFIEVTDALLSKTEYYQSVAEQQQSIKHEWALLDGSSGQRILALCDKYALE